MVPNQTAGEMRKRVKAALLHERGELSLPELAELTQLPADDVVRAVEELSSEDAICVNVQEDTGLKLIKLVEPRKPRHTFFGMLGE